MRVIEVVRKIPTPDGGYCVDYGATPEVQKCGQLRDHTESIGWSDGLGSPGAITHYRCAAFDKDVTTCYPHNGFHGLTVEKCQECLNA